MAKFNVGQFIVLMGLFVLGALIAEVILMLPFLPTLSGYIKGVVIAIIQILLIGSVGFLARIDFWTVLIGALLVIIGGILGAFLAGYLNLTGACETIFVVAIQTILLILLGFVKGRGSGPTIG